MEFKYGASRTVGGVTWYCQVPGKQWKTDPSIGYELARERDWYLFGEGYYVECLGLSLTQALKEAAALIAKGQGDA